VGKERKAVEARNDIVMRGIELFRGREGSIRKKAKGAIEAGTREGTACQRTIIRKLTGGTSTPRGRVWKQKKTRDFETEKEDW